MRILFIGGTRFVGRVMVEAALSRGHHATVLHRGQTGAGLFPEAEHLVADRDSELDVLSGRDFDGTIDVCAYVPRQVRSLAAALDGRGGHHVFVSSVSAYAESDGSGADESSLALAELANKETEDVTETTYGGLKVECERAAESAYGGDLSIVRPTYVVGPWDYTGRFTWWVDRISRGGEVLCPGPQDAPMQVIDARDMAAWTIDLVEAGIGGAFHAVSPPPPFGMGELLGATAEAVAPAGTSLVWADAGFLTEHGENGQTMPLWTEGETDYLMALDPGAAESTGLAPRPLQQTVRDTLSWLGTQESPLREEWGITPEREAELISLWRSR
jgi:nucleoside-diphosphate-sugar epimerase